MQKDGINFDDEEQGLVQHQSIELVKNNRPTKLSSPPTTINEVLENSGVSDSEEKSDSKII